MNAPTDPERRRLLRWLWRLPVLAAIAGGGIGLFRALRVHLGKIEPTETPAFRSVETVPVARVTDMRDPWSSVPFVVDGVPAVAITVPVDVAGGIRAGEGWIAAFSRVCTHQGCLVALNRSPEAIAVATNYRSDTPALVCPCHLSVFLPTRQGRAVSGPAVGPLPRVRLEAVEGMVTATGIEA